MPCCIKLFIVVTYFGYKDKKKNALGDILHIINVILRIIYIIMWQFVG